MKKIGFFILVLLEYKKNIKEIMENTLNIYQRVNCVMKEVTYIQKETKKVNGQYTFVSHDAVAGRLHEPLAKHGIVMVPNILELEQDGNRTKIKMEINFINIDKPEDRITIIQFAYGIDPQDKGIGKAQSYAVKYALLKLFCLETGDDIEKDNIDYQPAKQNVDPELLKNALKERKKEIISMVGDENLEHVQNYVKKLKEIYKSKTEEDLFLAIPTQSFIDNFNNWKNKNNIAA